ncbi:MAG: hypothetical protein ACYCYO_18885 [Bacilli bacterium]
MKKPPGELVGGTSPPAGTYGSNSVSDIMGTTPAAYWKADSLCANTCCGVKEGGVQPTEPVPVSGAVIVPDPLPPMVPPLVKSMCLYLD